MGEFLFWSKCIQLMDGFISDNDDPSLEVPMPVIMKAKDPFLQIKKKMVPVLNLGVRSALAIVTVKALRQIQKKSPTHKGKGRGTVVQPSPTVASKESRGKANAISPE